MKICIISSQIAGFGKIGGFGSMTRTLAKALDRAKCCEVSVIVPLRPGQKPVEKVAGVTIYGLRKSEFFNFSLYRKINADIYHSQNPNLLSVAAKLACPDKKHVITCRDPRSLHDWWTESVHGTWRRRLKNINAYLFEASWPVTWVIRQADAVGVPAHFLKQKVQQLYRRQDVFFLANIFRIPQREANKSSTPTICMVGRLDQRKRPGKIFAIAQALPECHFVVVGVAEEEARQRRFEEQVAQHQNITYVGYLAEDQQQLRAIYDRSWILLNTAAREGLPLTFIEAAGHGCAIVSQVNPDHFADRFGYWAKNGDFVAGIQTLIKNDRWQKKGQLALAYVQKNYEEQAAVAQHLQLYKTLLAAD